MRKLITLEDIERAVLKRWDIAVDELRGPSRARHIARPRQIVMFLARELTALGTVAIGAHFHRDHTTVVHATKQIRKLMPLKPKLAAHVEAVREMVGGRQS